MTSSIAQRVAQGLTKIAMALRHGSWREAGHHSLTPTQSQALHVLANRYPGRSPAGLNDVADALAITAATASDVVSTLVGKGLVHKAPNGRRVELRLTRTGRRLASKLADWPDLLLESVDELDEAEQTVFLRSVVKMIRSLQERGHIPVQRMCVECRFFAPHEHPGLPKPHHCRFIDAPLGDGDLLLDCSDQEPLEASSRDPIYQLFVKGQLTA